MQYKTITSLKSDLSRKVSNLNKIPGSVDSLIEEAWRHTLSKINPPSIERTFEPSRITGVDYAYNLPEHFYELIDIIPLDSNASKLEFEYVETNTFDHYPAHGTYTLDTKDGDRIIKIAYIPKDVTNWKLQYSTDAVFKNTEGVASDEITSDSDKILLDRDAYTILLYMCAYLASQEIHGEKSGFTESFLDKLMGGANATGFVPAYQARFRDKTIPEAIQYYTIQ